MPEILARVNHMHQRMAREVRGAAWCRWCVAQRGGAEKGRTLSVELCSDLLKVMLPTVPS